MKRRKPLVAGNWKMNTRRATAVDLASALRDRLDAATAVEVLVCPPFPYLWPVHEVLAGGHILMGGQDLYFQSAGAFTGEVAAEMLADVGCKYTLVGHSERRHQFGETCEAVNRKVKAALSAGLKAILCVGETLAEREAGNAVEVVRGQLRNGLVGVPPEQLRELCVAYEPVWAIGTGHAATPDQAQEMHAAIREKLIALYGADLAQATRVLYGGSVTSANMADLISRTDVDGALVGGASLKADEFAAIARAAADAAAA